MASVTCGTIYNWSILYLLSPVLTLIFKYGDILYNLNQLDFSSQQNPVHVIWLHTFGTFSVVMILT